MAVSRMQPKPYKRPTRKSTPFTEFSAYENGRIRNLKFDVNALADFEQETGMGFAQLMRQRAVFASARAMLWAGLKHEDRALTVSEVGLLLSDYLTDEDVVAGTHSIDAILGVAVEAAVLQGALGRATKAEAEDDAAAEQHPALEGLDPNADRASEEKS